MCSQVACNIVVEQHISTLENKLVTCHLKQKMSLALCTHTLQKPTGCLKNNTKMSSGTNQNDSLPMFLGLKLIDLTLQCAHYNACIISVIVCRGIKVVPL